MTRNSNRHRHTRDANHPNPTPDPSSARAKIASNSPTVCGLFAGIGGLEAGFRKAGFQATLLSEIDSAAQQILKTRFPSANVVGDINAIAALPKCTVVTAGFPCQDLSQVGRRQGISGPNSGLVQVLLALIKPKQSSLEWIVIENVPFMLSLDGGRAIRFIAESLEQMGYSWAYRTVDAMCFGIPQRRRRVVLLASRVHDPRPVLLGQDYEPPAPRSRGSHACGFYWTEGNTGLGWAVDAVPPLKGGSALHIPSPPAIWSPRRRFIALPSIEDAERLQGFEAGWTKPLVESTREARGRRWRMVGNAVSVPMAQWIAGRLLNTDASYDPGNAPPLPSSGGWPPAAWSFGKKRGRAQVSEWPVVLPHQHLARFLSSNLQPLSRRATTGFLSRLKNSNLAYDPEFAADLAYHAKNFD